MGRNVMAVVRSGASGEHTSGGWMRDEFVPGLVSVITPTYNRAHLFVRSLDSVVRQTYRPIELLLVDDGSTDATAQTVAEWKARHAGESGFELRYFQESHHGASASRNLGIAQSRGEFVQFLDSDDRLLPEKVSLQVAALQSNTDAGLAYSPWFFVKAGRRVDCQPPDLEARPRPQTVALRNLWTASPLYRRRVVMAAGPWAEDLWCAQEWEWNVRVLVHCGRAVYVPGALSEKGREARNRISRARRRHGQRYLASQIRATELIYRTLQKAGGLDAEATEVLAAQMVDRVKDALSAGHVLLARRALESAVLAGVPNLQQSKPFRILVRIAAWPSFCAFLAYRGAALLCPRARRGRTLAPPSERV